MFRRGFSYLFQIKDKRLKSTDERLYDRIMMIFGLKSFVQVASQIDLFRAGFNRCPAAYFCLKLEHFAYLVENMVPGEPEFLIQYLIRGRIAKMVQTPDLSSSTNQSF